MLYYDRIDSARSNTSKECIFLYLINVFDLMMCHNISNTYLINVFNLTMCLNISHIASITVEGIIVLLFMTLANLKHFTC